MLPWIVIALLIGVNALYVAAEFSAVAVQKSQIALLARKGNRRAVGLASVLEDGAQLDRYIAACQIGITLSSLIAGAYGQATIAVALAPWLEDAFGLGAAAAQSSAFLLVLLILTTLQVVLGELVPKSFALQFPERTALATYLPMRWSVALFRGFIWFLNGSGFLLLKPFGVTPGGHAHVHSPEEISILLAESHRGGALNADAHRRLDRALQLSGRTVRQMMTPRSKVDAIEVSTPPAEVIRQILESPYSRLPVYRDSIDHILGAVSTKDVAGLFAAGSEVPPLEQLLRPIPVVPESLGSDRFVRLLQQQRSSKAIVVDEHGGTAGIISIEDIFGELFGQIGDEIKQPEPGPEPLPDGTVRLPGAMRLDEAEPWLRGRWEGPAATVGGHVVATLGRLPGEGERLEIEGVGVTVTEMSPTAVRWIVVQPPSSGEERDPDPPGREGAS
jgi:putative hemolysin